jgi:hypothetical protein
MRPEVANFDNHRHDSAANYVPLPVLAIGWLFKKSRRKPEPVSVIYRKPPTRPCALSPAPSREASPSTTTPRRVPGPAARSWQLFGGTGSYSGVAKSLEDTQQTIDGLVRRVGAGDPLRIGTQS